jgi:hypothetical protein
MCHLILQRSLRESVKLLIINVKYLQIPECDALRQPFTYFQKKFMQINVRKKALSTNIHLIKAYPINWSLNGFLYY